MDIQKKAYVKSASNRFAYFEENSMIHLKYSLLKSIVWQTTNYSHYHISSGKTRLFVTANE